MCFLEASLHWYCHCVRAVKRGKLYTQSAQRWGHCFYQHAGALVVGVDFRFAVAMIEGRRNGALGNPTMQCTESIEPPQRRISPALVQCPVGGKVGQARMNNPGEDTVPEAVHLHAVASVHPLQQSSAV